MTDHTGHRERMRSSLRENGLRAFAEHEVLEMVLGFCVPRVDLNSLSHRLIERFGGINAIFEADEAQIIQKGGVSEHTARVLKALGACVAAYIEAGDTEKRFILTSEEQAELFDEFDDGDSHIALLSGVKELLCGFRLPKAGYIEFTLARVLQYEAEYVVFAGSSAERAGLEEALTEIGVELIFKK